MHSRLFDRAAGLALITAAVVTLIVPGALAAPSATVQCGEVITQDTKLANDLVGCPDDGLIIGADGVTLDLTGHTISGDNDPARSEEAGVVNPGFDQIVVKNGTITGFAGVVNAGEGGTVNDSMIRDIAGDGIFGHIFIVGDRNRIAFNTLTGGGDESISVHGDDNVIFKNTILGNWDIPIFVRGDRNRITHNFIRAGAACQSLIDATGDSNVVRHNDATGGGFCAPGAE